MDQRLAQIAAEYRRHRDALLAAFPELAEDDQALADTLDGETDAIDVIARFIREGREDEAMAAALDAMMKDMGERKQRIKARAERRRGIALSLMQAVGERKIERPDFTASVRSVPPKVEITDEAALPDALCKVTRSPDKAAIKQAIEAGEDVPGAMMSNGTETLTVRTK